MNEFNSLSNCVQLDESKLIRLSIRFFLFFGCPVTVWRWLPSLWNRPGHPPNAKHPPHRNQQPTPVPSCSPISFFPFAFSLWSSLPAPASPGLFSSPHVQQTATVSFWSSSLSFFPYLPCPVSLHSKFFLPKIFTLFFGSITFPQLLTFCSWNLWFSFQTRRTELTKHSISVIFFFFFFRLLPSIRGRHSGCFQIFAQKIWQCFTQPTDSRET